MNRIKTNLYDYVTLKPFKYLEPSIHSVAIAQLAVLVPYLILLGFTKSWSSLAIIGSAVLASIVCECVDLAYSRKTPFKWINCITRAIIIGLLLPEGFSPVAVFFVTLCTTLMCRYILGGFGDSWVCSAALAVAICWIIGTNVFPDFVLTSDVLASRNPSLALIQNGTFPVLQFDAAATTSLNDSIFSLFRVTVPEGYVSLLLDSQSVIPAFRFNLLTLVISIVLISFNFVKPLVPGVFILTYTILVRFVSPVFCPEMSGSGDILLALMTSGTLFCSLFLLQYVGTLPVTTFGKFVYGVCAGIIAFFVMGPGTSSVGFVFTVLLINVLSPVIQHFEHRRLQKTINQKLSKAVQEIKEGKNA